MPSQRQTPPQGFKRSEIRFQSTARLLGQTTGAAIVALVFGLFAGRAGGAVHGATLAVILGAGFAAAGAVASGLRLVGSRPRPHVFNQSP